MKKGLTGAIKVSLIFLFLIISLFFIYNIIPVNASTATIWTTDIFGNPKADFSPEEIVYIHGSNFLANKNVNVSVSRPDGIDDKGSILTDSIGSFVYNYQLDGIEGLYNIFATDGTNIAETFFTDSYEVNKVCKDYGFDFGVVKWEWNSGWIPEGGDPKGTSVTGNDTVANWNVGTSEADGIVVKAGSSTIYAINGDNGTVYQKKPSMSFIAFCGYYKCEENEELTEFYYESKPNSVYVDNKTANVSYKLCNGTQNIDVDTSDGKKHYIYMKWSLDVSQYDGAYYFDLLLYHKEVSTLIKVQLKDKFGNWLDVCDPPEYSSYVWSTCNLLPYWNIIKETPVIELRLVAWKVSTCHEYLGCAKIKTKLYKCEVKEYCGDGTVKPPEQCELPNTINNPFCSQTTSECLGKKLGQRDAFGDCNTICGCVYDPFQYSCVKDRCGAECSNSSDCSPNSCSETYYDYCTDKKLTEYDDDKILDSTTVEDSCENNCQDDCTCTNCSVDCSPPETNTYCVKDVCGAECSSDNDCNPTICEDKCVGKDYYDYDDVPNTCQDNCICTENECGEPKIYYNDSRCTECQTDDDCNKLDKDYCEGNLLKHDEGRCINYECQVETTSQNCYFLEYYCSNDDVRYKEGYCNPSALKCDFNDYFSESCDNDYEFCDQNQRWKHDEYCSKGQCDSSESVIEDCNNYNKDFCSDAFHWVHQTGTCQKQDSKTICALASSTGDCRDNLWCNGEETCSEVGGLHCEKGTPIDCSSYNLDEIATCDWNPDGLSYTFDYSPPFISTCDEEHDKCTEGSYTFTHTCADNDLLDGGPIIPFSNGIRNCSAECDYFGLECENKCVGNVRYYDGNCKDCFCDYKTEDCDSKDGCYVYGNGCEDRDYFCKVEGCDYTYSNRNTDFTEDEEFYCYVSEIRSHKKLHDFFCEGTCKDHTSWIDDKLIEDCNEKDGWYDTGETRWVQINQCSEKEEKEQEYRDYTCQKNENVECAYTVTEKRWVETGNVNNYPLSTTCEADEDPCTIDHCDGKGNCITYDYVPAPSKPIKTIGEPKSVCGENELCDWKVTVLTPITLYCENSDVKWRYALNGEWHEWQVNSSPITIYFPEECNHTLEAYCTNVCGESQHDIEKFKVEGTSFNITLNKKWNLISVPFVLINDKPEEVFKDVKEDIISVWTYDNGTWYLWTPNNGPDNLNSITPGWGYWVLTNKNTSLLIGGSLFSPATTPPDKKIVHGWNLIGYWGTEGQTGCYGPFGTGKPAYCELFSLGESFWDKGFSSLVTYWEPYNPNQWVYLNRYSNMDPGAGYWLFATEDGIYAFSTACDGYS